MSAPNALGKERPVYLVITAIFAALGGFLFGYDTGVISSAILFIRTEFHLTTMQEEFIVGIVSLGAIIGGLLGSPISDRFGRKRVIVFSSILFVFSAFVLSAATDASILIIGRLLVGIAIGISSGTVPVYIAELAAPKNRGALVTLNQFAITIGILVAFLVGFAFAAHHGWRWMFGLSAIPALLQLIGMACLPESPRWLVSHHKVALATQILKRIRLTDNVDAEVKEIQDSLRQERSGWKELFSSAVRPALLAGIGLTIVQQATGINCVFYYAPTIFQMTGIQSVTSAIEATVGLGTINVLATILAIWLIDRVGRKKLLYIGLIGMICMLIILGFIFLLPPGNLILSWLPSKALMAYVLFFAISLGPLGWLINSEIYPLRIRGRAMGLVVFCNWAANFLVTVSFLTFVQWFGKSGTFWIYALIGVIGLWFLHKFLPETKGKTLEAIEEQFRLKAKSR